MRCLNENRTTPTGGDTTDEVVAAGATGMRSVARSSPRVASSLVIVGNRSCICLGIEVTQIEIDVVPLVERHLAVDSAGNDVTGRELGQRMDRGHEAFASGIAK